jgi:hypothetical protein
MKMFIFTCLALLTISGCGATYTKINKSRVESTASSSDADCPNGIDYKTGQCR